MKKSFGKVVAIVLTVMLLLIGVPACTGGGASSGGSSSGASSGGSSSVEETVYKVGISLPTKSLQRWNQDGYNMGEMFKAAGFEVDLQYASDGDVPTQINQIENMIAGGCDVLVISAVDGDSLTEVLAKAKEKKIPVIAYDRLIMRTDAVSYYVTFDNWSVGTIQGQFIADKLDLANAEGPFNIEFFTGDPGDCSISIFYSQAIKALQPYLDDGTLVCPSGQTDSLTTATVAWKTENAQARMENLISSQGYSPTGTKLDAVMCSNDSTAQGVTNALVNAGYTAENFPIITGQDCDIVSVKNMIAGLQSMSVFKDTRTLAAQVVKMATQILNGETVDVNDTKTFDNGTGIIPTYLCEPVVVTVDNIPMLIESGYYTEDHLK